MDVCEKETLNSNADDICRDYDEDCDDLCHLSCWLYAPEMGICPYLTQPRKDKDNE